MVRLESVLSVHLFCVKQLSRKGSHLRLQSQFISIFFKITLLSLITLSFLDKEFLFAVT